MLEKITLDMLTQDSVSIKKQRYTTEGLEVGRPWRRAYINSIRGREQLQSEVTEPYKSVIMLMWGDAPTVVEETV